MRDNFEVITSIGNAKIKHVKKLADKSYRRGQGEFVIEGENLLKDLPSDVWVVSLFIQKISLKNMNILLIDIYQVKFIWSTIKLCVPSATLSRLAVRLRQ